MPETRNLYKLKEHYLGEKIMFRKLAVFVVLAIVLAAAYGAAAGLNVNAGTIQGGADGTLQCDPDGVYVWAYGLNTYPNLEGVESIKVKGVSAACNGARIMGRLYTPGFAGGDYVYTSGTGPYASGYAFVIANGTEDTVYELFLKKSDYATQVWVPAEYILEVKLWIEGETP
jgi:hypothetical protein